MYHKIKEIWLIENNFKKPIKNASNKVFESFTKQNLEQQGLILLNNIIKTKILFRFNQWKIKTKIKDTKFCF